MNKLIIEGMEYSLEKSTSILHHFNTPMVQFQGNTYYGLAVRSHPPQKPEKNYEILEGQYKSAEPHAWQENDDSLYGPCKEQGCHIYSIKRLSDGGVFKLGDTICSLQGNTPYIIERISTCNKGNARLWVTDGHSLGLHNAVKKLPPVPLFKTEDGVELFEGDKMWLLHTERWYKPTQVSACKNPFNMDGRLLFFAHEKNANDYMQENKPIFSLKELHKMIAHDRSKNH